MRNLKKLLAVIVAICVLATFTVPAFAETTKTAATIAEELGVIKGTGDGVTADYLATQPDRLQGAIMFLRLKGLEDDAIAFTGTDNFADVAGLNATNKAILAYLKAHPELGFGGIGGDKFGATLKMEAKQYYKVMLNALGYTYGTDDTADFTWNNVMSFAASKGLVKLADVTKFTVNDLCVGTVEALKATIKGGTDLLIAKLVLDGNIAADKAASTGLYVPSAVALSVVSATTDNLIVAKLVFNKELNKDTVTTTNIAATGLASVTLGDDNKTVYAKMTTNQGQDTAVDFTVENVKDITGATITKVVKTVTFRDTTIPSVTGVTVKNAKTLVITASEPMAYNKTSPEPLSSVKIDGNVAFGTTTVDYVKNTVTVNLYSAMATGTRKIDVVDLTDYAGYKAVAQSFNVEVVEDKTAPVLTSAKMNNSKELEVTFDEGLSEKGTFTVAGITTVTPALQSDNTKVKLTLSEALGIGAIVEIKIGYKDQKDVMGNTVKDTVYYTFKVEDDTTLPTVTAALKENNVIALTFSKSMAVGGTIKVVKASDSTAVVASTGSWDATSNNTIYNVTITSPTDPMDVKVNITGMKDASVRSNPLSEQNLPVKLTDTKLPSVQPLYTKGTTDGKDYATFYFDEAMNTDTTKALSNYIITGGAPGSTTNGALSTLTDVSLKEVTATTVSFWIPGINGTAPGKYNGANFTVYAVKDVAGNMKASSAVTGGAPAAFTGSSAIATAKNTIVVGFSDVIGTLDYTAFTVVTPNGTAYAKSATKSTTTNASIELWTDLSASTSGATVYIDISKLKSSYGVAMTGATTIALTDGIKPTATVSAHTTAGSISIAFDELINGTGLAGATTLGALSGKITLYKDGVVTTPAGITYLNGSATVAAGADFTTILIDSLDAGATYSVVINPVFLDKTNGNAVNFVNTSVKLN